MNTSEKIDQVAASMFAVNRDIGRAGLPTKNAKGQTKGNRDYRYLDLPALIEFLAPFLETAQLFVVQHEDREAGAITHVAIVTTVFHFSGQFMELGPLIIPAPMDAQGRGAAITYARRYALAAAFNLAADADDDAASIARPQREATTVGAPVVPPVQPSPSGNGEGSGAPTASDEQWDRLVAVCGGSVNKAVTRLNTVNRTAYTRATAREGATEDEIAAAITGGA